MWFKPRWSSVPSSVLDLCTTRWCREGLGCVWRSVVWVHVSSRKQFSNSVYLVCLSILSSSPKFSFKLWFHPKSKLKQNSASLLNFEFKWETTEFHLIFTQCYKSPWTDLQRSAGLWRTGEPFGRADRNIEFEFITQPPERWIFTWLHRAAFIWRQKHFFHTQPKLCPTPGVQNEVLPCFTAGKLTGALTYHCASWFRKRGVGVWRQAVLFHYWRFYCTVLCNAVGKAAKADSLGRFYKGPHQLPSLIVSLISPCPDVLPCPRGRLLGIKLIGLLVCYFLASILVSHLSFS